MKKILIILLIAVFGIKANAQQDAMFTHYMNNTLAINPAYAGSRDALTVTGLHRSQWVGFDGAPVTQTLTAHSPILGKNIGLGLSIINDKIGPTNMTSFYIDFSYKIKVTKKANLTFGLKGGTGLRSHGFTDVNIDEDLDPTFMKNVSSNFLPNFGFGMYYYTDKYYVGLSIPKLLENNFDNNSVSGSTNLSAEERHYFLIAGTILILTDEIKLKPTGFLKVTNGAPVEADLTATFIFVDKIWAGAMFRTKAALGILAGINITDQFAIGYSFDWSYTNKTFKYNAGSHEIMLRYDFIFNGEEKIHSPRYF